jgi:gliding motility-associated-like protein
MKPRPLAFKTLTFFCFVFSSGFCYSQLQVTQVPIAQQLAQMLVGQGVIVSNATLVSSPNTVSTGFFKNLGGTNIGIDSGIVITNGRAKSDFSTTGRIGVDGNGTFIASNAVFRASTSLGLPGDQDLADASGIAVANLHDAVILEFDVVPLGDTIKFNYCMSSEEYTTSTVCTYNDAFALLLSGPGITGKRNLALVPGTTTPVTITNVNNITTAPCVNNPQYYIDNTTNLWFTHDGHTTVFTAKSDVQPCQTYHLKFVIADRGDFIWDSGVFIEAGSLSSDPLKIDGQTPLNQNSLPYLAEGCQTTASIHITRPAKKPLPQTVSLTFGGTAINGVDIVQIPSTATIPANDSVVVVPVVAIADGLTEGTETFKIYISNVTCGASFFLDSIEIEIRDIDMLPIIPPDSANICKNGSIQLLAAAGYTNYSWTGPGLDNPNIANPNATPPSNGILYICTATTATCTARDSVKLKWKAITTVNTVNVNCQNGTTGQITVSGINWQPPVTYAINNQPFQSNNVFTNLAAGTYTVKMMDGYCIDSTTAIIGQAFPNLTINTTVTDAGCSTTPGGQITINAGGGNNSYSYSIDGTNYQAGNSFSVFEGNYTSYVKDGNSCIAQQPVVVNFVNTININAGPDAAICEGKTFTMSATGNAQTYSWSPASSLNNPTILDPVATPTDTTQYFITAVDGRCTKKDSVIIAVRPAPVAVATADASSICTGLVIGLHGSGGVSYDWTPASSFITATNIPDPRVKPSSTITYYLTVTDANQCKSLTPSPVTINVTPSVKIFAGNDTAIAIGQPLQLKAVDINNSGINQYTWTPGNFLSDANISNPVATVPYDMTYKIAGTTADGCYGEDEVTIKAYKGPDIYVPTAFTPNGDGLNDVLRALPIGMKEFHYFRVFNRWGQVVFTTTTGGAGWDGKIKDQIEQTATYIWIAEAVDFSGNLIVKKGTVVMIR